MAKYKAGDKIMVDGRMMTLGSWPQDDLGPFTATYLTPQGSEVFGTYWAGQVTTEGEPVHTSDTVTLVEAGDGVQSTLEADAVAAAAKEIEDAEAAAAAAAAQEAEAQLIEAVSVPVEETAADEPVSE